MILLLLLITGSVLQLEWRLNQSSLTFTYSSQRLLPRRTCTAYNFPFHLLPKPKPSGKVGPRLKHLKLSCIMLAVADTSSSISISISSQFLEDPWFAKSSFGPKWSRRCAIFLFGPWMVDIICMPIAADFAHIYAAADWKAYAFTRVGRPMLLSSMLLNSKHLNSRVGLWSSPFWLFRGVSKESNWGFWTHMQQGLSWIF